jgi:hypothetical protein
MSEFIHEHSSQVQTERGTTYRVLVYGEQREDGTWVGWIEFHPAEPTGAAVLRTSRETTQPNLKALDYWASGLEPAYLEGALSRAR